MRLICPNCGAQYEVDDRVIPESGRDVQCSACGHAWYQMPQGHTGGMEDAGAPEPDEVLSPEAEEVEEAEISETEEPEAGEPEDAGEEPEAEMPPRRPVDEGVRSILREEAEQEMARRASEQVETQPDLGLDSGPSPEEERRRIARERMARMRGLDEDEIAETEAEPEAETEAEDEQVPRRDRFPDIEEINSTLDGHGAAGDMDGTGDAGQKASGFGRGFFLIIFVAALLLAVYLLAPQLAETIPAIKPALVAYVEAVNAARAWLDQAVQGIIQQIEGLTSGG